MSVSLSTGAANDATLSPADAQVTASTEAKIRTFLYEVAQGTRNYRSLHSLTQQVEHQYHGRFLVELIQNAHDALHPDGVGRISIHYVESEGPHGVLYVANDGQPFSQSNFESLSQLGQSDKDPQESIGNKGIGFRSVLEISDAPEVFSRLTSNSEIFDGYCFGFYPQILDELRRCLAVLPKHVSDVPSPCLGAPLLDWDGVLWEKFCRALGHQPERLLEEIQYLSPYLLPVAITLGNRPAALKAFETDGFATVIRLPVKSSAAAKLVGHAIEQFSPTTALFLDRLGSLLLHDAARHRCISRQAVRATEVGASHTNVTLRDADGRGGVYCVWSRVLAIDGSAPNLRDAVARLPGKWPTLSEARISIAIRQQEPDAGELSIFLPTRLQTGSACHISAPFFGDMSRMHIDFAQPFNQALHQAALDLLVDVIDSELAGRDARRAPWIVDLLAPALNDEYAQAEWTKALTSALERRGVVLAEANWFLTDVGWSSLDRASVLPEVKAARIFTPKTLREHARFSAFHASLDTRRASLSALADIADVVSQPSASDIAATAEAIAVSLRDAKEAPDWTRFWVELEDLLPDPIALRGKRVLLGEDGDLHSSGHECSVFFTPKRASGDDELVDAPEVLAIPDPLRPHVAFLHSNIVLYDTDKFGISTPTRRYLERGLVNRFRVEDILSVVLGPRRPKLPIALADKQSALCSAILQWGMTLLLKVGNRSVPERIVRLLRDFPVPCQGGWFPAKSAVYGSGWRQTQGSLLTRYLRSARGQDCAELAKRVLLPPTHRAWGSKAAPFKSLLDQAGVFDGVPLRTIDPSDWKSRLHGSIASFWLTAQPPPCFPASLWPAYREHANTTARPYYNGTFSYQLQTIFTVPGLATYDRMHEDVRAALMDLVLGSAARWPKDWMTVWCEKLEGNADTFKIDSPLHFALTRLRWIGFRKGGALGWYAPSECWHVPAKSLSGRAWQFEHLRPLPHPLALQIEQEKGIGEVLSALGMPALDLEHPTDSTMLLESLAGATFGDSIRDPNVFLGQVRAAWSVFTPAAHGAFPTQLVVRRTGRPLAAMEPTPEDRILIPDSTQSALSALDQFSFPVLAIEPRDARRLAARFRARYGEAIVCTSEIELVPVVDGRDWSDCALPDLKNSELHWVIPIALTITAHFGPQARGAETKRFEEQATIFRQARVRWCSTLDAALRVHRQELARPRCNALWAPASRTLFMTETCRRDSSLLSEALASMLDRDDLELPLKCALRGLQDPGSEAVFDALSQLKIEESQYRYVRDHWRGDLRFLLEALAPLVSLVNPTRKLAGLLAAESEDALLKELDVALSPGDSIRLVDRARRAVDAFEFGRDCYYEYGTSLQLDRWNEVSRRLAVPELKNEGAETEFEVHALEAKPALRCLLVHGLRLKPSGQNARQWLSHLDEVRCPVDFAKQFWEVTLSAALSAFVPLLRDAGADEQCLGEFARCESVPALADRLRRHGVSLELDPADRARRNLQCAQRVAAELAEMGLAWALSLNNSGTALLWESRSGSFLAALANDLDNDAYFTDWSDADILRRLEHGPKEPQSEAFWSVVRACTSIADVRSKLGLDSASVQQAAGRLSEMKQRAAFRKRIVDVCGRDFEHTSQNLGTLWSHICLAIPDVAVASLHTIDLSKPAQLASAKHPYRGGSGSSGGSGNYRAHRDTDELVGLVGEIHAYRRLQAQFGISVVTSTSWISSNGRIVQPGNADVEDDAAGCDFRFAIDGIAYHVEVKSSAGHDDTFTLGSSEIRLAMKLAHGRQRKSVFLVLRVLDALSASPQFLLLPNPYEHRYEPFYDIVDAGARIRYHLASQ